MSNNKPMSVEEARAEIAFWKYDSTIEMQGDLDNLIAAVRAEEQEKYAIVKHRLEFLEGPDTEEADGTDAAHPAYWRGEKDGADSIVRRLTQDLDEGKHGVSNEPLEGLRLRLQRIASDERATVLAEFRELAKSMYGPGCEPQCCARDNCASELEALIQSLETKGQKQ